MHRAGRARRPPLRAVARSGPWTTPWPWRGELAHRWRARMGCPCTSTAWRLAPGAPPGSRDPPRGIRGSCRAAGRSGLAADAGLHHLRRAHSRRHGRAREVPSPNNVWLDSQGPRAARACARAVRESSGACPPCRLSACRSPVAPRPGLDEPRRLSRTASARLRCRRGRCAMAWHRHHARELVGLTRARPSRAAHPRAVVWPDFPIAITSRPYL